MKTIWHFPLITSIKKNALIKALDTCGKKYGYVTRKFETRYLKDITPDDIFVIWNRHMTQHACALEFERIGAKVILFENAYIKVKTESTENWYSVALGIHNNIDYAIKCQDNGERFRSFNRDIKDWKHNTDGHYLIATQAKQFDNQGIGYENYKQPPGWDSSIINKILKNDDNDRKIRFRFHPNARHVNSVVYVPKFVDISLGSEVALVDDLKDAYATIVYTSNTATDSLLEGVPVFYTGPSVFLRDACKNDLSELNDPLYCDNREELFNRIAWSQYSESEIASGLLFELILDK